MRSRAERRHNESKKRAKRKKHTLFQYIADKRQQGKFLKTPKCCDHDCCCNERRNAWAKGERLTLQERRENERFRQISKDDA